MNQYKTDARTGLQYELQGDYYLIAGEDKAELPTVGIWGQCHLRRSACHKTEPSCLCPLGIIKKWVG